MKVTLFCFLTLPLWATDLSTVHSVYLLPMSNGMDQYLANRLTGGHAVQVVTNPQRADAVFTDRLGEAFQSRLDDLYPPPEAKEAPKPAEKEKAADKNQETTPEPVGLEIVNKVPKVGSMTSFGRARGTLFLVDVKSRQVIWSIYERPKDLSSQQLDRAALRIVERLKQDIAGKP
jgi:hypothetical protein